MPEVQHIWEGLLTGADKATISRARFGRRVGHGTRPALLVIDAQNYMVGPPSPSSVDLTEVSFPSACGPAGQAAISEIVRLVSVARGSGIPVFYTVMKVRRDGQDMGVYGQKRDLMETEGWMLEESVGAEIVPELAPASNDIVLPKLKPSAFFGTPLLSLLQDRSIDTLVVVGGSTSNCVRATVVDAASYNYRTLVPYDSVFDRIDLSHRVALFDMDRQYGDVVTTDSIVETWSALQ